MEKSFELEVGNISSNLFQLITTHAFNEIISMKNQDDDSIVAKN